MNKRIIYLLIFVFGFSTFLKSQVFQADIPNPTSIFSMQERSNWCWAASNQMLLKSQKIFETQPNQVKKLFLDSTINRGAGPNFELSKTALNGTYINSNGDTLIITPYVSYLWQQNGTDPVIMIQHLQQGIPLIMGTQQHAKVCVGVDYWSNGTAYQILSFRLLNPVNQYYVEYVSLPEYIKQGLIGFMTMNVTRK